MLDLRRLVVFVGPEEADVEVVAGIFEVVGVAAEERDVEFGSEDQPDVGVFFVAVQVVLAPLVQVTTSLRRPVLSSDSFSIVAITARRAAKASAATCPA